MLSLNIFLVKIHPCALVDRYLHIILKLIWNVKRYFPWRSQEGYNIKRASAIKNEEKHRSSADKHGQEKTHRQI